MTFEDHVNKLGKIVKAIFPMYDSFDLYETDDYFFISVKRSVPLNGSKYNIIESVDKSVPLFSRMYEDLSEERIVARGDSLAALEEELKLLKNQKGK